VSSGDKTRRKRKGEKCYGSGECALVESMRKLGEWLERLSPEKNEGKPKSPIIQR